MPRTVRFAFDYVSPNAYLAWTQLAALAARHGAVVEPVPVLFAALLDAHGQRGPAEVPAKIRWMWRNTLRKAALLGVPMRPPAFHPFNPLLALRASSLAFEPSRRAALVTALFDAVWARGLHVADEAVVRRLADEVGLDGTAVVARAQGAEAKARVRAQTEAAVARGVFGVPTMEVDGELFWGFDDFPHLELFLAGRDPLPATTADAFSNVRPSAVRPASQAGPLSR